MDAFRRDNPARGAATCASKQASKRERRDIPQGGMCQRHAINVGTMPALCRSVPGSPDSQILWEDLTGIEQPGEANPSPDSNAGPMSHSAALRPPAPLSVLSLFLQACCLCVNRKEKGKTLNVLYKRATHTSERRTLTIPSGAAYKSAIRNCYRPKQFLTKLQRVAALNLLKCVAQLYASLAYKRRYVFWRPFLSLPPVEVPFSLPLVS